MTTSNQKLGHDTAKPTGGSVDFVFLAQQTFDDRELQRDVLALFVEQSRRIVPALPGMSERDQALSAHLLSGSARGIGAWDAAAAARAYEEADSATRASRHVDVLAAFADAETAIIANLEA